MTLSVTLKELFPAGDSRLVTGLTADSREVRAGSVFVAVPGTKADGLSFVPQAVAAGAVAIVAEQKPEHLPREVAFIKVADARRALALGAANLYDEQPETIVAVTGTSGKSSVVDFARQLFIATGKKAASLGTIGVVKPDGATYGSLTTPDPITLHKTLTQLAEEGVTHLAMEASSHGLDQRRLDGVRLAGVAFTNLGRDHLDYHPTLEDYFKAKLRLFTTLAGEGASAVVNMDDDYANDVVEASNDRDLDVIEVGYFGSDLMLVECVPDGDGQNLQVAWDEIVKIRLPLIGQFQVSNALVAAGLVIGTGVDAARTLRALEHLKGVPGRMESLGSVRGAPVIVDYAHKPDALVHVLAALRPFARGRLICVFGCGGDRDTGKRPLMGKAAIEGADVVIVTDDNPRSEEPAVIRKAVLEGAPGGREIGDRATAIREAIQMAKAGDVVLIAGKGHETGQIVGERILPFSDHEVARAAMREVMP